MKLRYLTLALALAGTLTACEKPADNNNDKAAGTQTMPADDSKVLATVNGTPITENTVKLYMEQRQRRSPGSPADKKAVLEELISLELVRQAGEAQGIDKSPEVQAQLAQQRRAIIASAAFQKQLEENPITEEELKALYDEKTQAGSEYKARHILVKDKETAENLIAELDKGADFAELAKEHSTGPSGKSGGDLGWFAPKSMVKPFSDAVIDMEKGAYTKEPVKTQFGWHIIQLEDTRKTTPPPFEQVKPQLEMMVRSQRVQDYIQSLRSKADIQIVESEVAPAPAPATAEETRPADTTTDSTASEEKPAVEAAPAATDGNTTNP
jgi:peptidyl-prolyl cis-trans isomerase C